MLSLGNKLTLNSAKPIYHFVNKYSIDFDGSDQRIITDGADTVAQPTTYSFWAKSSVSGANKGIFGHGGDNKGAFHYWSDSRPIIYLGANWYVKWDISSKQSDGEWHHWVVYSDTNNLNNCKLYVDGVLQNVYLVQTTGSLEAYTESLTIGSERQVGGNSFEGKIDEFAVYDRELTQDEITRMYNTYYSPNRVANGNFSQIGNEEVTNGDFSQIGSEEIVNGDFDTSIAIGTNGSGWSRFVNGDNTVEYGSGGVILTRGSNSSTNECKLYANTIAGSTNILTTGKNYKLTYTVVANTNVTALVYYVGGTYTNLSHNVGTHTLYFTQGSNQLSVFWNQTTSSSITIDNVSVKEVGQDWEFNGESELTPQGSRVLSTAGSQSFVKQNSILVIGKSYKVTFDVISTDGTNLVDNSGNSWGTSTTGAKTIYYTATGDFLMFKRGGVTDVTITNISVKEVGQHWTFGTGWSTDGTKAIFTATGSYSNLTQGGAIIGRTYKITFDATRSAGTLYVKAGSNGTFTAISSDGSYSISSVAAGDTNFYFQADTTFAGTVDNIVVQELKHDATNLMLNAGAYQSANPLITSTKSMDFFPDNYLQLSEPFSYTNHTITGWLRVDTLSSTQEIFSASDSSNDGVRFTVRSNNELRYRLNGVTVETSTIIANKWYNFAATYDGTTAKIYLDGVLANSTSATETLAVTTNSTIGKTSYSNINYFDGQITELGTYNRPLTALEVASLYNQGMPTNLLVNRNNYQSGNPTVFNTKQVDFDGVDDKLVFNTPSAFSGLGLNSFDCTLSAWAKFDTIGQFEALVSLGTYDLEIAPLTATDVGIWVDNAGLSTTYTPTMGEWNHYVATKSGNTYSLYVDGVLIGSDTDSDNATIGTQSFIGSNGAGNYFDGDISQVGVWNEALTADEVSSLYNHGLPIDLTTNQAAYESSYNLVGYWRMGSGTLDSYPLIADQTNATLGSEKVVNGDFATDSDWTKGAGWTISGGKANSLNSSNSFYQSSSLVSGKSYRVTFDITNLSSGQVSYRTNATENYFSENGTHTITWLYDGSFNYIYFLGDNFTGSIDNVSVKQVNGNPAMMINLGGGADFSDGIKNGSPYANVVQNGTFDTDSDWTKQNGSTISGGVGNVIANGDLGNTGANWSLYQDVGMIVGRSYNISFSARQTGGTGNFQVGQAYLKGFDQSITSSFANYSFNITASDYAHNTGRISIGGYVVGDTFEVDNVTVEEVNTGLQGYWKMGDGTNDEYPYIFDQTNPTYSSDLVNTIINLTNPFPTFTDNGSGSYTMATTTTAYSGFEQPEADRFAVAVGEIYKLTFDFVLNSGALDLELFIGSASVGSSYGNKHTCQVGFNTAFITIFTSNSTARLVSQINQASNMTISNIVLQKLNGNPATMTNMVEGNITNQFPLTKIRNYYRMGDGILDGYPIIQDQTSPNLAHIPTTNLFIYSEDFSQSNWFTSGVTLESGQVSPIGDTSAFKLTFSAANDYIQDDMIGLDTSKKYTISFYAKVDSGTTTIDTGNIDAGSYEVLTVTDEWQRFKVTQTPSATTRYPRPIQSNGNDTIYLWGCQFEEQSQATAYIKSDGIAAVRKSSTTNLIPYSEDFSQSLYSTTRASLSLSNILSPIGLNYAYELEATTTGNNGSWIRPTISPAFSGIHTISLFAKKGTQSFLQLRIDGVGASVIFDLNTGVVKSETSAYGNIESYSNGWYRCSASITASSSTQLLLLVGNENMTHFVWSVTSGDNIYLSGLQLEQQTQAETYAKTTGLPVTIDLFTENNYGTMTNMSASDIVEDTP